VVKPEENISGKVGLAATANSDNSATKFKDFSVTEGSVIKYASEFPTDTAKWKITGSWAVAENAISTGDLKDLTYLSPAGLYVQGNPKGSEVPVRLTSGGSLILNDLVFNNCTISVNIMTDSVFNGFNIRFGVVDDKNYFTLTISNPRMRRFFMPASLSGNQNQPAKYVASVEHVVNGTTLRLGTIGSSFDFNMDTWHNIKVSINGKMIACTVDDNHLGEIEYKSLRKQHALAGYDKANGEVIVKVVNGEDTPFSTEINLTNAVKVEPVGQIITLSSVSDKDDNSFAEPKKVTPVVSEYKGFSNSFKMEFLPNSFTILRIKASR